MVPGCLIVVPPRLRASRIGEARRFRISLRLVRTALLVVVAAAIGTIAWLYRFNEPAGSYAGLADDHFFYVVRGWQILFGELPTRDFIDPGAPLTFVIAAATQWFGGRGTLSEMQFCVSVLSVGAALTFALASHASRSVVLGAVAALLQVVLLPRLYNYPKILVYAAAIPLLWALATKSTAWRRFALAVVTAVAFLLRYDHGVFVALATAVLYVLMTDVPWRVRVRHALVYGGLVLVLLAPYLVYVQMNGGLGFQFETANSWSQRDRARAPLVWPAFGSDAETVNADSRQPLTYLERLALQNRVPSIFYLWVLLPLVCLGILWRAPHAFRPDWPRARVKVAVVAILAIMLNVGFLRGNLSARFADVSVPQVILLAWLIAACVAISRTGRWDGQAQVGTAARVLLPVMAISPVLILGGMIAISHRDRDVILSTTETRAVIRKFRHTWPLEQWGGQGAPGPIRVAQYLESCTRPGDHVFVTPYLPQVVALSGRPFAGGHGDLRPDFFNTDAQQRLTIDRLRRQSVPVVIMPPRAEYAGFQQSFPLLDAYMQSRFRSWGALDLGDGTSLELLVDKARPETGRFELFDWPCFR
jgi:hypothetical protein